MKWNGFYLKLISSAQWEESKSVQACRFGTDKLLPLVPLVFFWWPKHLYKHEHFYIQTSEAKKPNVCSLAPSRKPSSRQSVRCKAHQKTSVAEGPRCKVGVGGGERLLTKLFWGLEFQQMLFSITQLFASKQMFDITLLWDENTGLRFPHSQGEYEKDPEWLATLEHSVNVPWPRSSSSFPHFLNSSASSAGKGMWVPDSSSFPVAALLTAVF